jgi:hypothetical protein
MVSPQSKEVARLGQALYDRKLRNSLEATNPHAFVAIEPQSEDYYLGKTLSEAVQKARTAHPDRLSYVVRVGHPAAVQIGAVTK